jgi:hypothetical protein
MSTKSSNDKIYEIFKKNQQEMIRILRKNPKNSNTSSYVTHSDEFVNYHNSGNSYSSNVSYSSNNSSTLSDRNVTFTSLLG